MLHLIAKRLLFSIPTLLVLITLAFFLLRLAPGGPFDGERVLPEQTRLALQQKYQLNQPLHEQYVQYLVGILKGDFGPSFQYKQTSVGTLIAEALPISIKLGALALLLALTIGVSIGVAAAVKKNSWTDKLFMQTAMLGISIPNFVFAPLLILLFSLHLNWLPAGGWNDGQIRHMVLPIIALALPFIAYIARLMRASMLEVLNTDPIRTARAKGLSEFQIILRHALPTAVLPLISWLGPASVSIMTGSVVIEKIFGIPGLGRYFVNGALNRDYTLVMGVIIVLGIMILAINLMVDLISNWLDPRIRQGEK